MKIVATADAHLDPKCTRYGSRANARRADFRKGFLKTVDFAIEKKADIFLVAGDLFDGMRPSNGTHAWVMHQFKRLSDAGVNSFVIGGNHDTPRGISTGVSPLRSHGNSGIIHFFENPTDIEAIHLKCNGKEVTIVGVGYNPLLQGDEDPLNIEIPTPSADINILMLHYPIAGFQGFAGEVPLIEVQRIPSGFDLTIAGHYHAAQQKRVGTRHIIIPGSTERVTFNEEEDEKSFVYIEVDGSKIDIVQIPVEARPMRTESIEVKPDDQINQVVEEMLKQDLDPSTILRILVTGVATPEGLAAYDRQFLIRKGDEKVFKTLIEERDLHIKQPEAFEIVGYLDPYEELAAYFDSMIEAAESEEKKSLVQEAKTLCLSQIGGRE